MDLSSINHIDTIDPTLSSGEPPARHKGGAPVPYLNCFQSPITGAISDISIYGGFHQWGYAKMERL